MQRLEFSGAVRPLYGSLGVKGLITDAVLTAHRLSPFMSPTDFSQLLKTQTLYFGQMWSHFG